MKVIQVNIHSEASLLLHIVFQPILMSPQNPNPKIDPGTPLIPFLPPPQRITPSDPLKVYLHNNNKF